MEFRVYFPALFEILDLLEGPDLPQIEVLWDFEQETSKSRDYWQIFAYDGYTVNWKSEPSQVENGLRGGRSVEKCSCGGGHR